MQQGNIDFGPLTQHVGWRQAFNVGVPDFITGTNKSRNLIIVLIIFLIFIFIGMPILMGLSLFITGNLSLYDAFSAPMATIGFVAVFFITVLLVIPAHGRRKLRVMSFAKKNGFTDGVYASAVGLINFFADRDLCEATNIVRGSMYGYAFEAARWQLYRRSKQGRFPTTQTWASARFSLDRQLPRMVFDNKLNNIGPFSNLPVGFARKQIDTFEGDLHKYYNIYAPSDYNVDIRTIFTPEVLWLIRTLAAQKYDFEIVDSWLVVYAKRKKFESVLGPLLTVGASLAREISDEADNYQDDRSLVRKMVAREGAHLKPSLGYLLKRGVSSGAATAYLIGFIARSWQVAVVAFIVASCIGSYIASKRFEA